MLKYRRILRASAQRIANAANRVVDFEIGGVHWTAKTLTSQGNRAQEKTFGADFLGVLHLDLPEYVVRKGFLAQAKLADGWSRTSQAEWDRMIGQCKKMLSLTPASFVFVYSTTGITVIPAIAIISATDRCPLSSFYSSRLSRFYENHFKSFIGDMRLSEASIGVLEDLAVEKGLLLEAHTTELELRKRLSA